MAAGYSPEIRDERNEYYNHPGKNQKVSRAHFERSYFYPEDMKFSNSDALFPRNDLAETIKDEYTKQCQLLRYGPYPSWEEVQASFAKIKELL